MLESSADSAQPTVSVILPTYNRARFLRQAIASIKAQWLTDWELIIVDDGSTDGTCELIPTLTAEISQHVSYVRQENQGAYGARNTGLDHARGKYIAFFDSDDEWLPHHLADCVGGLEANPTVSWVYGACQIVDDVTGNELAPTTFYLADGSPRLFRRLPTNQVGRLHVITDSDLIRSILRGAGLYAGLQNSVIHSRMFENQRFRTDFRNEAEDQLFVLRSVAHGCKIGYFDNVHVVYRVHSENSSGASTELNVDKRFQLFSAQIRGFEDLPNQIALTPRQLDALNEKVSRDYFWDLGYAVLWMTGRRKEALKMFAQGLRLQPFHLSYWKTYVWSWIRFMASRDCASNSSHA